MNPNAAISPWRFMILATFQNQECITFRAIIKRIFKKHRVVTANDPLKSLMNTTTQQGFLIIADITGFTPFVAETELEHSNEILQEMLKGILSYMTPTFTLAEVEGDAVFVYAPIEKFPRGETILEIIESFYIAFRDKKSSFHRVRTCGCKACQMAPLLDLKFIVHYGEYIMNSVSGKKNHLGHL